MKNKNKYGFKIRKYKVGSGSFLFGVNLNTNDDFSEKREFYLNIYLFKYQIVIGWFTY